MEDNASYVGKVFIVSWVGDQPITVAIVEKCEGPNGDDLGDGLRDVSGCADDGIMEFDGPESLGRGLWVRCAEFKQWGGDDLFSNIEEAIVDVSGSPADEWRRPTADELAALASGGVSDDVRAWMVS